MQRNSGIQLDERLVVCSLTFNNCRQDAKDHRGRTPADIVERSAKEVQPMALYHTYFLGTWNLETVGGRGLWGRGSPLRRSGTGHFQKTKPYLHRSGSMHPLMLKSIGSWIDMVLWWRKGLHSGRLSLNPGSDDAQSDSVNVRRETERSLKWSRMFQNWDKARNSRKVMVSVHSIPQLWQLKERCQKGIPDCVRGMAWKLLTNSIETQSLFANQNIYKVLCIWYPLTITGMSWSWKWNVWYYCPRYSSYISSPHLLFRCWSRVCLFVQLSFLISVDNRLYSMYWRRMQYTTLKLGTAREWDS